MAFHNTSVTSLADAVTEVSKLHKKTSSSSISSSKSPSSSSLAQGKKDQDSPDFDLKRSISSSIVSAKFRNAAKRTLARARQQSKLIIDDTLKNQQQSNLLSCNNKEPEPEFEEQSNEDFLKTTTSECESVLFQDPTDDELEVACDIALRTYYDLRVFNSDTENRESMDYIQKLFSNMPTFKTKLLEKEKDASKKRPLVIKCELIKGSGLPARDADGKSDPYCKMVILDKKHINEKIIQKGNIDEWITANLIEKQAVFESSVIPSTLDPVWNDAPFELDLQNPDQEYLVIEVWDSDKEDQKKKIKGFKGFGKFLSDLAHEDDFMGRAFYLLKHVSVKGEEKELELYSHSGKHMRGSLTLNLSIVEKGGAVVQSENEKFEEYEKIVKVVMAHESKQDNNYIRRWNGNLSIPGQNLLTQHATLRELSKLRQAAVHFSLLLDYHKSYAVSMTVFQETIHEICKYEASFKEVRSESAEDWVYRFISNIQELYHDIVAILRIHLERYSLKSEADVLELKAYLITLASIHSSQTFLNELSDPYEGFNITVTNAIQGAVPAWFLILSANLMPTKSSIHDKVLAFKALCTHCLRQTHRVINGVQPVFIEVGIDYFSPFFYALDKLLYTEAESVLSNCTDDTSLLMSYEIFQILQEMKPYSQYMNKEFLKNQNAQTLYLDTYYEWFKGCVPVWIRLAQMRATERLGNAVGLDQVVNYTDQACFSSSAVDAHGLFVQVLKFWKDLNWPDRQQSLGYFATIMQSIADLAMHYADLVSQKVTPDYYTDPESGQVVITDKLCITLNNIQHMKTVLSEIEDELDLDKYYKFLDENSPELSLSKRAAELKKTILSSADEDIQEKKNSIVRKIHALIVPTVQGLVGDVMEKDSSVPSETAFEPLLDYIASNMGKLGESLLTPNFLSILELLWNEVIGMLQQEYQQISHKSNNIYLFSRLKDLAITLTDFFEAGGNGLKRTQMETQPFKTIVKQISLAAMSTQQLIRVFLQDLVKQQQEAPAEYGILRFSHLYHTEEKALQIHVLSAENIPALDRSGKSDPFIVIHLLPTDLFPNVSEKHYKTDVQKQTLNPFFNQKFNFSVESYKMKEEGAVLLLAMFDWDHFGKNDFAGICVVSTSTTPQGTELKMEHLNLFHYKHTLAYKEIDKRSSENLAHDFLKLMKKFVFDEDNAVSSPTISSHIFRLATFGKSGHQNAS